MAEIYIRTDPATKVVTFTHRRPFDPIHGLGQTREELLKTGFFVSEFPTPNSTPGMRAVAYYDHETKQIRYEYRALPFPEKARLDMLEDVVTNILTHYPELMDSIIDTSTSTATNTNTYSAKPINITTIHKKNETKEEEKEDDKKEERSKRRYKMASRFSEFLAYQIHNGKMSEKEAYELYPELEDDIKSRLEEWNIIPEVPLPEDMEEE